MMFKRSNRKKEETAPLSFPQEEVARRAYEKFQDRGGVHGEDLKDWLEAEQELKARPSRGRH